MGNGARRETQRGGEVGKVDVETQKVGFGDHTDKTYVAVLTKNPKYAEYLMGEGRRRRLEMKKFTDRVERKNIPIVAKEVKEEASE